jgi:dTDP-4-dehydrorhamnose reductase
MTFDITTSEGSCSRYEFTKEILKLASITTPIAPLASGQSPQKAWRPHYSVLDNSQLQLLGMDDMRPWPEALTDYMVAEGHIK